MEAAKKDISLTYQDYIHLPEDKRYELIEGELYMTPSPMVTHQRILQKISLRLGVYLDSQERGYYFLAPLDVYLSETTVVQPDIIFIHKARKDIITASCIQGPPDMVVEILSSSTSSRDRITKKTLYGKFGVTEYWIVDPTGKTIEILRQGQRGLETVRVFTAAMNIETELLPGFHMKLENIFSED